MNIVGSLLFNPGRKKKEILVLVPMKCKVFSKGLAYREQHRKYSLTQLGYQLMIFDLSPQCFECDVGVQEFSQAL